MLPLRIPAVFPEWTRPAPHPARVRRPHQPDPWLPTAPEFRDPRFVPVRPRRFLQVPRGCVHRPRQRGPPTPRTTPCGGPWPMPASQQTQPTRARPPAFGTRRRPLPARRHHRQQSHHRQRSHRRLPPQSSAAHRVRRLRPRPVGPATFSTTPQPRASSGRWTARSPNAALPVWPLAAHRQARPATRWQHADVHQRSPSADPPRPAAVRPGHDQRCRRARRPPAARRARRGRVPDGRSLGRRQVHGCHGRRANPLAPAWRWPAGTGWGRAAGGSGRVQPRRDAPSPENGTLQGGHRHRRSRRHQPRTRSPGTRRHGRWRARRRLDGRVAPKRPDPRTRRAAEYGTPRAPGRRAGRRPRSGTGQGAGNPARGRPGPGRLSACLWAPDRPARSPARPCNHSLTCTLVRQAAARSIRTRAGGIRRAPGRRVGTRPASS